MRGAFRSFPRAEPLPDVARPDPVRSRRHELRSLVGRMPELRAPLATRALGSEDPAHRALGVHGLSVIEQRGHDLARRSIDEARIVEDLSYTFSFGSGESTGRGWAGCMTEVISALARARWRRCGSATPVPDPLPRRSRPGGPRRFAPQPPPRPATQPSASTFPRSPSVFTLHRPTANPRAVGVSKSLAERGLDRKLSDSDRVSRAPMRI